MAINIRRPTFYKISAVKEFTDRIDSCNAFWKCYSKMVNNGSTVINFYGAGGVGKSALLKKIEEEIKHHNELTHKQCIYVTYDFNVSTDLREILRTLKFQLSSYGCEFPFFDSGNYYYSLKIGHNITPLKAKSLMKNIPWVKKINDKLRKADSIVWKTSPFLRVARNFLEVADEVFQVTSIPRAITTCFSVVDSLLMYYMERNKVLDEDHEEVRNQLNARREEKNSTALYEYLPTLFAMDVADWLKKTGNKLVVIFDNYESLISETSSMTPEQLKRDLWLRGYDGLIFMIPDTLWTIAGRNKLCWQGELADELEQHLITALSPEHSALFLQRAGISDEALRDKIVKLTEGYPIFLDLCVDVYVEYKRQHNNEPPIGEFGTKRQDVVSRIFRYLDANRDDVAKDMLEFLCLLNVWTDELAVDIGGKVLKNFSRNTYKRVKNFSFIQKKHVENGELDLTVYRFDKTIQSILFDTCDKKLIADVNIAVDEYFKNYFLNLKFFSTQNIFYLKLWAEIIVRFVDDAAELSNRYKDGLRAPVSILIGDAHFDAAEEILEQFLNKFENLSVTDTLNYTCFEMDFSWLRRSQGKYNEAYELANSAYEKCRRLLGEEDRDTVAAMHKLAISLSDLGRHEEALEFREKVLTARKNFPDVKRLEILSAMNNLALSLSAVGRLEEAMTLQEQVLTLSKEISGEKTPDTISAMNNLAVSLSDVGKLKEAVELQKTALTLSKEILGEGHPDTIAAMNNLANSLRSLSDYDEALKLKRQLLKLSKKTLGEEHPNTLVAMNNLAVSLSDVGLYDKAVELHRQVFELSKRKLGLKHANTLDAMNNLVISLNSAGQFKVAATVQEQVLDLTKKKFGAEHLETLNAMNNLAVLLNSAGRLKEVATVQEQILDLSKKLFGEEHPKTLDAMNNLAWTLTTIGRDAEALTLLEVALPAYKRILGADHPDTFGCADTMIHALNGLGRNEEAIALQKEIALYEKS